MNGFAPFVSATADAAANQTYFIRRETETKEPVTSRAFFRLSDSRPDQRTFRLWFSNALDSTFGPGKNVLANALCEAWDIDSACVWISSRPLKKPEDASSIRKKGEVRLTFDGKESFRAEPGAVFSCDPFALTAEDGQTLVLEMTFRGHILPYHKETLIPVLRKGKISWYPDARMPLPVFVGEEKTVQRTVGFLGDSITQGIGSGSSAAAFPSIVQELLGPETAVWNLGIGYARAADAASNGYWLQRAKQNDTVFVCLGVNDIGQEFPAEVLCGNLKKTVLSLREAGCDVILLTPPPFNFEGESLTAWDTVVYYCEEELSRYVKRVFRTDSVLAVSPDLPWKAKYGPHPNAEGHRALAEAIVELLR